MYGIWHFNGVQRKRFFTSPITFHVQFLKLFLATVSDLGACNDEFPFYVTLAASRCFCAVFLGHHEQLRLGLQFRVLYIRCILGHLLSCRCSGDRVCLVKFPMVQLRKYLPSRFVHVVSHLASTNTQTRARDFRQSWNIYSTASFPTSEMSLSFVFGIKVPHSYFAYFEFQILRFHARLQNEARRSCSQIREACKQEIANGSTSKIF